MKFFQPPIKVCAMCPKPLIQNQLPLILLNLFSIEYLNHHVRITRMVNSVDYYPGPSALTSKLHPLIFPETLEGFISLQNICSIFT